MIALVRNNILVALVLFAFWFGINYFRFIISAREALLALLIFYSTFFVASYLALRKVGRSFLWAILWTVVSVVVSGLVIMFTIGLGFTHI